MRKPLGLGAYRGGIMNTVEEAIRELQMGHLILVVDDPDRENEGDLICAAQFATTANVNFMATNAKGLICMPMSSELAHKLNFTQMVTIVKGQSSFCLALYFCLG